jgi:hypothetical protein
MPNRTAKIVAAIFVSILAAIPLMTVARGETANAEDCLSSPKAETPPGSHWHYRIDHVNKRNCWYLRYDGGGLSQALPQSTPPVTPPAAKPSIADARAELRPQQAIREASPAVNPPTNAVGNETNSTNASVWGATATVATRWPELPPASTVPMAAAASNVMQPSAGPVPVAAQPSVPFVYLSVPIRPETIPTLFAATVGALAFAGAAALISRRRRTRLRRRKVQSARGPVWDATDDDRIVLSDYPTMDNRDYRPRFARSAGGATAASTEFVRRPPRRATR